MSESDLYRKQRVAIESVAHTIAVMEDEVVADPNGASDVDVESQPEPQGIDEQAEPAAR